MGSNIGKEPLLPYPDSLQHRPTQNKRKGEHSTMTTESDAEARREAARRLSVAIDSLTPTQRRVYGILYGVGQ